MTSSACGMTAEEVTQSIHGFDEIAIEKHFDGFDIYLDAERRPVRSLRALVFVHLRHGGMPDKEAHTAAMEMTVNDVQGYFQSDAEANPDDPDTDSGKGVEQPSTEPNA